MPGLSRHSSCPVFERPSPRRQLIDDSGTNDINAWIALAPATVALDVLGAVFGGKSVLVLTTGTTGEGFTGIANFWITPNCSYEATTYISSLAIHLPNILGANSTTARLCIAWYDGAGSKISESQVASVSLGTIRTNYKLQGTALAPSTAMAANLVMYQNGIGVAYWSGATLQMN